MRIQQLLPVALFLAIAGCQAGNKDKFVSSESGGKLADLINNTEKKTDEVDPYEPSSEVTASIDQSAKKTSKNSSDRIASYIPPKAGTVYTWRNNWANLPEVISYRVAGTTTLGETEYVKFTSVKGLKVKTHAYYNTEDFSLKGYRDGNNKALVTFKPVEQRYRFPMAPGDKWLTQWKQKDHKTEKVTTGGGVVQVIRMETLNLPAGKFRALKVKMPVQKNAPKGLTHYAWFSPELGITVKEEIGGGILNWSQVLEKVERP